MDVGGAASAVLFAKDGDPVGVGVVPITAEGVLPNVVAGEHQVDVRPRRPVRQAATERVCEPKLADIVGVS